jgi:Mor family transcriptional regulator
MRTTTTERNPDIFSAYELGKAVEELAESFKLAPVTVLAIITAEKHKIEVSLDKFYQGRRESSEP